MLVATDRDNGDKQLFCVTGFIEEAWGRSATSLWSRRCLAALVSNANGNIHSEDKVTSLQNPSFSLG